METTKKLLSNRLIIVLVLVTLLILVPHKAGARFAAGARTYFNRSTGDMYLGGDFLELGISRYGYIGALSPDVPVNFYGHAINDDDGGISLGTNPSGFGNSPDLRMDYVRPGSPEDRWAVGYKIEDSEFYASNSLNSDLYDDSNIGDVGIKNVTVRNQSTGTKLQAQIVGTYNKHVQVTQTISFNAHDKFIKNIVTLKNVSSETIGNVRFMNSLDPDNTEDQNGEFNTHNVILHTISAGDNVSAVSADTSNNSSDPVFLVNHTRSPILLFSSDNRARVSTFGFANGNPYDENAYDGTHSKGYSVDDDIAISIAFDVGSLSPNTSATFTYYTSVDNRGGDTAINTALCGKTICPL